MNRLIYLFSCRRFMFHLQFNRALTSLLGACLFRKIINLKGFGLKAVLTDLLGLKYPFSPLSSKGFLYFFFFQAQKQSTWCDHRVSPHISPCPSISVRSVFCQFLISMCPSFPLSSGRAGEVTDRSYLTGCLNSLKGHLWDLFFFVFPDLLTMLEITRKNGNKISTYFERSLFDLLKLWIRLIPQISCILFGSRGLKTISEPCLRHRIWFLFRFYFPFLQNSPDCAAFYLLDCSLCCAATVS